MGEAGDHADVLAARQVLVHRGVLAGQPDDAPHHLGLLGHVVAQDRGAAFVGLEDGGEDAHGRGLAGAVGAEQAENRARLDLRARHRRARARCRVGKTLTRSCASTAIEGEELAIGKET